MGSGFCDISQRYYNDNYNRTDFGGARNLPSSIKWNNPTLLRAYCIFSTAET